MNKRFLLMITLALAALLLTACGEPALQADISHDGDSGEAQAEGGTIEETPVEAATAAETPVEATPTEEATAEVTATEAATVEATVAEATAAEATPAQTAAEVTPVPGDPAHGEELFTTMQPSVGFACATCHRTDSEEQLIGPGLLNISVKGATFIEGMDAYDYIHQSITDPGAYVVSGFPDNLMPRTYSDLFSAQDIEDIIAYLYTLTG